MFEDIRLQWKFFSHFHTVPVRLLKILAYTVYTAIFARPFMQLVNQEILRLALHAAGYDNWWSLRTTGEERFFKMLAKCRLVAIIDIGANTGVYSERLLKLTNARVIAFEPQPRLFDSLLEIQRKYKGRFFPLQKGVGDVDGTFSLKYGMGNSQLASFCEDVSEIEYVGNTNDSAVDVEVVSLDSFMRSYDPTLYGFDLSSVDLVKIDVEGFEFEVLQGARNFLIECRPKFIQMEFNYHQLFRGHTFRSLAAMLSQYDVFRLLPFGNGLVRIEPSAMESNIFSFSNYVFIRQDVVQHFLTR